MRAHHCAAFLLLTISVSAQDPVRPAKEILRDFDRVPMPGMSSGSDPESLARFRRTIDDGCRRKAELAAELQRSHPEHPRLPKLLATRWAGLTNALGEADAVLAELRVLLAEEGLRDDVRREARRALARARIASDRCTNVERFDAVTALIEQDDTDDFAPSCLLDLVEERVADPETQRMMWELAVETWPDSPYGGRVAKRWLHVLEMLGEPFADRLPEAQRAWFASVTGAAVDYTVVQIWSGWAGIDREDAELAALRELRRQLGDRVRLIGFVNGDFAERRPGIEKAGVDWPQAELLDPEPMTCPFGAPKSGFLVLLDRELRVAGIVGHAALLRERIATLDKAAH